MLQLLSLFILPFLLSVGNSNQPTDTFVGLFNKIPEQPIEIIVSNQLEINKKGGHIQGIQLFQKGENIYAIATGSSDSYSYCFTTKLGKENKVVSVSRLMEKPFKHAGGFQIFENYIAVGIEDNSAKDKSKVCIYSISDKAQISEDPVFVIERTGEPMRSTAGCVGMTRFQGNLVLAVGDWDTKHLDFYVCRNEKTERPLFKKEYTIDTSIMSKKGWIDKNWIAYQNINLFSANNHLFMVGLGQNDNDQNMADLYRVDWKVPDSLEITKVASKVFTATDETSFKAAAGACYNNGMLEIISCGYHVDKTATFNLYSDRSGDF